MSAAVRADDGAVPSQEPGSRRPNVSGDLPTLFHGAPQFRRAIAGYDRFQVDTYVQWAEDELATAEREREHLEARHLRTRVALEDAEQLLSHSPGGAEFLRLSDRIGPVLAAAADQAESMTAEAARLRDEAQGDRAAAAAQARQMTARAEQLLASAQAAADRMVAEAVTAAEESVAAAERTREATRTEVAARLAEVRAIEERAAQEAALVRERAVEEASAAALRAREEIVGMLATGREQRRRADAEAEAIRERLDRDAAVRRAALLDEVARLEQRRSALLVELALPAGPAAGPATGRLPLRVQRALDRLRWYPGSVRAS